MPWYVILLEAFSFFRDGWVGERILFYHVKDSVWVGGYKQKWFISYFFWNIHTYIQKLMSWSMYVGYIVTLHYGAGNENQGDQSFKVLNRVTHLISHPSARLLEFNWFLWKFYCCWDGFQLVPKYQTKVKLISNISVRNIWIAKNGSQVFSKFPVSCRICAIVHCDLERDWIFWHFSSQHWMRISAQIYIRFWWTLRIKVASFDQQSFVRKMLCKWRSLLVGCIVVKYAVAWFGLDCTGMV